MKKRKYGWGEGGIDHLLSGRFRVRWRQDGKRRSLNFPTRELAETFRRGVIGDIGRERAGIPRDPKSFPLLGELFPPWLERRERTNPRCCDSTRWNHLAWFWAARRATDVRVATVREYVETMRFKRDIDPGYLRVILATFSAFLTDLAERPFATGIDQNPLRMLPRSIHDLLRSKHDPRFTPYVERLADVPRLYKAFAEDDDALAYAIGVVAGLRTAEVAALDWAWIHEAESRIDVRGQVQGGRLCIPKDDVRVVQGPFLTPLFPLLRRARLASGGRGTVLKPGTHNRQVSPFVDPTRFPEALRVAARACGLFEVSTWKHAWYQATRHTMATHWMRAGHSLGELALALGHSSTAITDRYAHIRPSSVRDGDPWKLDFLGTETGSTPGQCP